MVHKVNPEAVKELREALKWYKEQSPTAAERFVAEINYAIAKIKSDPQRFVIVDRRFRSCTVNDFPYQIIYKHQNNQISIVAFAHAKRRPGYWKRRK